MYQKHKKVQSTPYKKTHEERTKMTISSHFDAKPAVTHFEVIQKYKFLDAYYSLLKVNIETGRTHQIRVHMQAIDHPIVADQKYGNQKTNQDFKKIGLNRQFLHAASLEFDFNNEHHLISTELPEELQKILDNLTIV